MKRFRVRISSLCWLVVVAAAFLGGIRYGEYRAAARPTYKTYKIRLSAAEVATLKVVTAVKE